MCLVHPPSPSLRQSHGWEGQEAGDFLVSAEDSHRVPHLSLRPGHGSFSSQTIPLWSRFPLSPPARARTLTSISSLPWRVPRSVRVTGLRGPEGPGEPGIPFMSVAGASEPKFCAQPLQARRLAEIEQGRCLLSSHSTQGPRHITDLIASQQQAEAAPFTVSVCK